MKEAQERTESQDRSRPIVIWETARSGKEASQRDKAAAQQPRDGASAPLVPDVPQREPASSGNVVPFRREPETESETTVSERIVRPAQTDRPIVIRIVSSGFGDMQAGRGRHSLRLAA